MSTPTRNIRLSLQGSNLPNVAGFLKGISDPYAVLTLAADSNSDSRSSKKLGKTEVVKNCLSPDWVKSIVVEYAPDSAVSIMVKIYDEVSNGEDLDMGSAVFDLAQVLEAKGNTMSKKIKKGGSISLRAEDVRGSGSLILRISGKKLRNTEGFLRKSDPFFEIKRKDMGPRGSEWNAVHRSEVIRNNLEPQWSEQDIDLSHLCYGEYDMLLKLIVYDYESDGKHVIMGEIETTVNGFVAMTSVDNIYLKMNGETTGELIVHKAQLL